MMKLDKLLLATHNSGKVREIRDLLLPYNIEILSAADFGLIEPEETEDSFVGNALLKARAAADASNLPALSDDSGLEVHALKGAPGIFSARWAGPTKDFGLAMSRVESELLALKTKDYSARFICVLALAWPNGDECTFEGVINGTLCFPKRGNKGFGYDPIFIADGEIETFGEMEPAKKHAMSHRARAFEKLVAQMFEK